MAYCQIKASFFENEEKLPKACGQFGVARKKDLISMYRGALVSGLVTFWSTLTNKRRILNCSIDIFKNLRFSSYRCSRENETQRQYP